MDGIAIFASSAAPWLRQRYSHVLRHCGSTPCLHSITESSRSLPRSTDTASRAAAWPLGPSLEHRTGVCRLVGPQTGPSNLQTAVRYSNGVRGVRAPAGAPPDRGSLPQARGPPASTRPSSKLGGTGGAPPTSLNLLRNQCCARSTLRDADPPGLRQHPSVPASSPCPSTRTGSRTDDPAGAGPHPEPDHPPTRPPPTQPGAGPAPAAAGP